MASSWSVVMEDLLQRRPPLVGRGVLGLLLADIGEAPPALGLGVLRHPREVRREIVAVVLEVADEQVAVQVDAVVPDVAGGDGLQHARPDRAVEPEVFLAVLGPEPDDLGVAGGGAHRSTASASSSSHSSGGTG